MHQQQLCPQRRFRWDGLTDICTQCLGAAPKAALSLSPFSAFFPAQRKAPWSLTFKPSFIHVLFTSTAHTELEWMPPPSLSFYFSPLPHCFLQTILWIINLNFAGDFHNTHRHRFMVSEWPIFRCMLLVSHCILCKTFYVDINIYRKYILLLLRFLVGSYKKNPPIWTSVHIHNTYTAAEQLSEYSQPWHLQKTLGEQRATLGTSPHVEQRQWTWLPYPLTTTRLFSCL